MDKDIDFQWASFPINSKKYADRSRYDNLVVGYVYLEEGLSQILEAVKRIKSFGDTEVTLGDDGNCIRITGLTDPTCLEECRYLGDSDDPYIISGNLPSLQWFLEYKEEVENPSSSTLLYVGSIAVQIAPSEYEGDVVAITSLDTKNLYAFIDRTEGEHIEWLGGTFDEFLEGYGYTGKDVYKAASLIFILLQVAVGLGFKSPEELATHFGDKCLIADLKLKGVFEDVRERVLR